MNYESYSFSIYADFESGNSYEAIKFNFVDKEFFLAVMSEFPEFTNFKQTVFFHLDFIKYYCPHIEEEKEMVETLNGFDTKFLLDYDAKKYSKRGLILDDYNKFSKVIWHQNVVADLIGKESYRELKLFYDIAQRLGKNLVAYHYLVDEAYLETLRVKDENQRIKLDPLQKGVIASIESQGRWYHIPSDDQEKIMACFPIRPAMQEVEITEVIDDVQFQDKVCLATIPGHTIIFGFNLPYMNYASETDYKSCQDHTARLKEILNKLSKAFGSAELFEYREADPDMMRMVLSKKGKFAYASLYAEGEFSEEFGTSKRSIPPDAKTYWKTVKKWGMAPSDLLTYVMKQKLSAKVFPQNMYW